MAPLSCFSSSKIGFGNVTIKDLKLYGAYTAQRNSSGFLSLPSSNSFYDYIDFHTPGKLSIKIKIAPGEYGGPKFL